MEKIEIKTDFDFGWKEWRHVPDYVKLVRQYQGGDILDIGCATCQLNKFLRERGWKGKYFGIDNTKYKTCEYPKGINLTIGDILKVNFPEVDTVVLYNILEHIDEPIFLLRKSLKTARCNVLVNVPKRNEELWQYGIAEFHQLDKLHKHCGFSKEEVYKLVDLAGGKIRTYRELGKTNATVGMGLWNNIIPKGIVYLLGKIFSSKTFYQEMWCEVVKK